MDGSRFDALLRSLTTRRSRRGLLGGLAILALPLPALLMPSFEVQSAARPGGRRHARRRGHEPDRLDAERRKKKKKTRRKPRTLPPGTPPPTCAQSCAGCCAGETCRGGTSIGACGKGGAACATCGGTTPLCIDQTCQPCDVCANGCLYGTVQEAIAASISGETIRLCAGVYAENIVIDKSLSLIGAGDGNGAGNTLLRGTGTDSVVIVSDAAKTVTLRHLRIAGGLAPSLGGAISNHANNLTLTDCTLNGNHAVNTGGAIANFLGTTLTMTRCTVSGNTARSGAGIDNQGTVNLIDSNITGNEASEWGGGIYGGGVVTLDTASRVTGNKAAFTGGGIYNLGGAVMLSSTDNVTGNTPDNCAGSVVLLCAG